MKAAQAIGRFLFIDRFLNSVIFAEEFNLLEDVKMTPDAQRAHEALGAKLDQIREEGHLKLKANMEAQRGGPVSDSEVEVEAVRRGLALYNAIVDSSPLKA